jgi:hypothetical protein
METGLKIALKFSDGHLILQLLPVMNGCLEYSVEKDFEARPAGSTKKEKKERLRERL